MGGGAPDAAAITICGETATACGTTGDTPGAKNPYFCKDCDTVTIYEFAFSRSGGTASPICEAIFTVPEDYGDVYYSSDHHLYDAFGKRNRASSPSTSRALTAWHQGIELVMCIVTSRFKANL